MAYQKIPFTPDYGGVTANDMNHIQTQYDEAAADLNAHKSASPIDHPDGSVTSSKIAANAVTAGKLADGAVDTLARVASGIRTTPGGTEPNRLAVTNASGRVGDSERLGGRTAADILEMVNALWFSSWTSRSSGTSRNLYSVAYGNGLYVAVGDGGTILTSPDGATWTSRSSGTTQILYGVTYGGGMWAVVGASGTILTSPDGVNWTARTSGTTQILRGVAYGGMWVVVGEGGTIRTSTTGTTWTSRSSGTTHHLFGVAYGNEMWLAVGSNGTILTSPTGTTWTSRSSGVSQALYGVTYGGGMWAAVGNNGTIIGTVKLAV